MTLSDSNLIRQFYFARVIKGAEISKAIFIFSGDLRFSVYHFFYKEIRICMIVLGATPKTCITKRLYYQLSYCEYFQPFLFKFTFWKWFDCTYCYPTPPLSFKIFLTAKYFRKKGKVELKSFKVRLTRGWRIVTNSQWQANWTWLECKKSTK